MTDVAGCSQYSRTPLIRFPTDHTNLAACINGVAVFKGTGKRGHIVADTLLLMMFLVRANARDTKRMLCFHVAQTGKHLLWIQNVSEQNQKHFLCPGHKSCVRNKCCARGQTGKHLCRQQCVRNNVSSFAGALRGSLNKKMMKMN